MLNEKEFVSLKNTTSSFLLVALHPTLTEVVQNNKTENKQLNEGSFLWISAGTNTTIKNANKDSASFALLELK